MKASAWARYRGALVPVLAVGGLLLLLALLASLVELDRALLPKPAFRALALHGYPEATRLQASPFVHFTD